MGTQILSTGSPYAFFNTKSIAILSKLIQFYVYIVPELQCLCEMSGKLMLTNDNSPISAKCPAHVSLAEKNNAINWLFIECLLNYILFEARRI